MEFFLVSCGLFAFAACFSPRLRETIIALALSSLCLGGAAWILGYRFAGLLIVVLTLCVFVLQSFILSLHGDPSDQALRDWRRVGIAGLASIGFGAVLAVRWIGPLRVEAPEGVGSTDVLGGVLSAEGLPVTLMLVALLFFAMVGLGVLIRPEREGSAPRSGETP